jgi:outer membrane receptor protein involved in Fe transport
MIVQVNAGGILCVGEHDPRRESLVACRKRMWFVARTISETTAAAAAETTAAAAAETTAAAAAETATATAAAETATATAAAETATATAAAETATATAVTLSESQIKAQSEAQSKARSKAQSKKTRGSLNLTAINTASRMIAAGVDYGCSFDFVDENYSSSSNRRSAEPSIMASISRLNA